jgi:hypothetical protein
MMVKMMKRYSLKYLGYYNSESFAKYSLYGSIVPSHDDFIENIHSIIGINSFAYILEEGMRRFFSDKPYNRRSSIFRVLDAEQYFSHRDFIKNLSVNMF